MSTTIQTINSKINGGSTSKEPDSKVSNELISFDMLFGKTQEEQEAAYQSYKKAAAQGVAEGFNSLIKCLTFNLGVPTQDYATQAERNLAAFEYCEEAVGLNKDNLFATHQLAIFFYKVDGIPKEKEKYHDKKTRYLVLFQCILTISKLKKTDIGSIFKKLSNNNLDAEIDFFKTLSGIPDFNKDVLIHIQNQLISSQNLLIQNRNNLLQLVNQQVRELEETNEELLRVEAITLSKKNTLFKQLVESYEDLTLSLLFWKKKVDEKQSKFPDFNTSLNLQEQKIDFEPKEENNFCSDTFTHQKKLLLSQENSLEESKKLYNLLRQREEKLKIENVDILSSCKRDPKEFLTLIAAKFQTINHKKALLLQQYKFSLQEQKNDVEQGNKAPLILSEDITLKNGKKEKKEKEEKITLSLPLTLKRKIDDNNNGNGNGHKTLEKSEITTKDSKDSKDSIEIESPPRKKRRIGES